MTLAPIHKIQPFHSGLPDNFHFFLWKVIIIVWELIGFSNSYRFNNHGAWHIMGHGLLAYFRTDARKNQCDSIWRDFFYELPTHQLGLFEWIIVVYIEGELILKYNFTSKEWRDTIFLHCFLKKQRGSPVPPTTVVYVHHLQTWRYSSIVFSFSQNIWVLRGLLTRTCSKGELWENGMEHIRTGKRKA